MMGGQGALPVLILKEGTRRESGKSAQMNNIAAARAIADAVRSTLGPKGMDKMLVDSLGDVVITNDGVTILKEIDIEHPAAKMMVEVAKTQDQECGDGTTTSVILAGELLKRAEELLNQNLHPTVIASGYRLAASKAIEYLEEIAKDVKIDEEEILKQIAVTSMMSKSASAMRDHLAAVAVKAVKDITEKRGDGWYIDLDNLQIVKKQGGSITDTEVINGIIIDKEKVHSGMPEIVEDAKIALVDSAFEIKKTEVDAKIQITSPEQLQQFLEEEERVLREMVEKIKDIGANVLFCQKGIDDLAQHYLAKNGIYAVRRVKKSDMTKLAKATGAKIVTNIKEISENDLGTAEKVEQKKVGDDKMTFVTGCKNPKAVSILIRGGTEHVVDEIERSLNDALHVVADAIMDGKISTGGGSAATEIAIRLREYANSVSGREQMAVQAFADALEVVPRTLAENAGHDPIDVLLKLRSAHSKGEKYAGIDINTGDVADMFKMGVIEPLRVGRQAIQSATDAAVMILRIDDIIAAKETSGGGKGGPGGPGGGGSDFGGDFD